MGKITEQSILIKPEKTKKRILFCFGTRPEAIKMAPLIKEFEKYPEAFDTKICVTGQQREMLDQVLNTFHIKPDYDMDIMSKGQDLSDITIRILSGLREILKKSKPNLVLVHGDTTTSYSSALAAFYEKVPIGHVEAGLRTHNIKSPWPEEMNRQMISKIATYHFAPTLLNKKNLMDEGIRESNIFVTGNTVIDALHLSITLVEKNQELKSSILFELSGEKITKDLIEKWDKKERRMILMTKHRRENLGESFETFCLAVKTLAKKYKDVDFVYPVHLNPCIQKTIYGELCNIDNVYLTKPLDYLPFLFLMKKSLFLISDSGGIQEEAPSFGKPVLLLRNTTERPEAMDAGIVKLIGTDYDKTISETSLLLDNELEYKKRSSVANPYGDGTTSKRIVKIISELNIGD